MSRYSRITAYHLLDRDRERGLAALRDGREKNRGAPTLLTAEEQQRLSAQIHQDFEQGMVGEGKRLQAWT
ncbi:hypothetical protein [Deinococcus hopiensis]|uniref:hypothetical protein n=1 Tax=Deinococcus hopiensis TaxID=309885 RepID=UPI00111C88F4|nr:hypothetical protein [Deinococcus hopiensis]